MDIKKLKPNPNSHYKQGYFDVSNSTKYIGMLPVIYRSGLELKCFGMFERANSIVKWSSEPHFIKISYTYNNKSHQYHIDAYIEFDNGKRQIVEIKPHYQTIQPILSQYKSQNAFIKAIDTYKRNIAKWEAAWKFAKTNGMEFKILTDVTINKYNI